MRHKTALFSVMMMVCFAAAAPGQFRGDRQVESAVGDNRDLAMVVSGNHHYVLYSSRRAGFYQTFVNSSQDGGRTWTSEHLVGEGGWRACDAVGPDAVVAWVDFADGGHLGDSRDYLYVDVTHDGGRTYTRRLLSTSGIQAIQVPPAVEFDGASVSVFWIEDNIARVQISTDKGATWLPEPQNSAYVTHELLEAHGAIRHALAVDAVGCCDYQALYYRRSIDGGDSWGARRRIDQDIPGHQFGTVNLVSHESSVSALWVETYFNGEADVYLATSQDDGVSWTQPVRLNDAQPPVTATVTDASLAASGKTVLVAFSQAPSPTSGEADVFARWSTDDGMSFAPPTRVNAIPSTPGHAMGRPRCGVTDGRGVVAWYDPLQSAPFLDLVATVSRDDGQTWSAPVSVSDAPALGVSVNDQPPFVLGYDGEGAVGLAWQDYRTGDSDLFAESLHQPSLALNGTLAPGNAISFTLFSASASEEGRRGLVVLSATGAGDHGGFPLPGPSGRVLLVDFDALTLIGLTMAAPALTTTPLSAGAGDTPTLTVPTGIVLPPLFAVGVVIDFTSIQFGSFTDTLRLN